MYEACKKKLKKIKMIVTRRGKFAPLGKEGVSKGLEDLSLFLAVDNISLNTSWGSQDRRAPLSLGQQG